MLCKNLDKVYYHHIFGVNHVFDLGGSSIYQHASYDAG